jgi:hypothetical protein
LGAFGHHTRAPTNAPPPSLIDTTHDDDDDDGDDNGDDDGDEGPVAVLPPVLLLAVELSWS